MKSNQYTIRAVPPQVDARLRGIAKKTGRSLNEVAVETLARGAGLADEPVRYHDLDGLIGAWQEDPEFDAAVAAQRRIDPDLWS